MSGSFTVLDGGKRCEVVVAGRMLLLTAEPGSCYTEGDRERILAAARRWFERSPEETDVRIISRRWLGRSFTVRIDRFSPGLKRPVFKVNRAERCIAVGGGACLVQVYLPKRGAR